MNKSFALVFFISPLIYCGSIKSVIAQNDTLKGILPIKGGDVFYTKTYVLPGIDKGEIFRRARRWWVLNYKSAKDVLHLGDEKTGELIGKGYTDVVAPGGKGDMPIKFMIHSVMSLDAKDESYTITVSQLGILNSIYAPKTSPIIYKRSPEKNLIRVFKGIDEAVKETFKQINEFIVNGER